MRWASATRPVVSVMARASAAVAGGWDQNDAATWVRLVLVGASSVDRRGASRAWAQRRSVTSAEMSPERATVWTASASPPRP